MRRARIPIIMVLILSLGVVAGYFVSEGLREGMGTPQPTQMPLEWSYIIIAAREIPRGARIESDDVVQAPFPADMLVETMQTDTREVVGLWALQDIGRGVPITQGMVTRVRKDTVANSEDICSPTSADGQRACPPVGDSSAPRFEVRPCNEVFPNDEDILQWETETSPLSIYLGDLPPGLDPPIRFGQTTCGLVNVPSNHASPGGPTISLAVLILPSTGTNPEPDPLFWAQGGPGGSTVSDLKWLAHDSPLRVLRDMVLFDQRAQGTLSPALIAPSGRLLRPRLRRTTLRSKRRKGSSWTQSRHAGAGCRGRGWCSLTSTHTKMPPISKMSAGPSDTTRSISMACPTAQSWLSTSCVRFPQVCVA